MKQYKNLVVTGCSFMEGGSLSPYHSRKKIRNTENILTSYEKTEARFSKKLADKLNAKEINIGSSGSSNERSIRALYEWVKDNEEETKDTLFIFGLTELLRSEKFNRETKSYIKWRSTTLYKNLQAIGNKGHSVEKFIPGSFNFMKLVEEMELVPDLLNYIKTDILLFTDLKYEFSKLSRNLEMLSSFIKSKGGRLITFAAMLELDEELLKVNGVNGTIDIPGTEFFSFPNGYNSWRPYIKSYDDDYQWSYHPSVKDDSILADLFYEYLKNK